MDRKVAERRGAIAVVGAALLWGCIGPVAALYPESTSLGVAAWRLVFGAASLLVAVPFLGGWRPWRRTDAPMALSGIASVAAYSAFYFPAVALSGVAVATVVSIGAAPVMAGITHRLHGGTLSRPWLIDSTVAIAGMALVVLPDCRGSGHWLGVLLSLLAAAAYSWQAHSINRLSSAHQPVEIVAVLFTGAAAVFLPLAVLSASSVLSTPQSATGVVFLGVFTTAIAYALFAMGVPRVGPHTAVSLSLIEPIAATVLAALVAHQIPGLLQVVGVLVTTAALLHLGRNSD
jgi:DME family drug/metabolite transporter